MVDGINPKLIVENQPSKLNLREEKKKNKEKAQKKLSEVGVENGSPM